MSSTVIDQTSDSVVVQPAGDLVAAMLPDLRERLRQAAGAGVKHLVLDLSKVYMVDSAGIGLMASSSSRTCSS